MASPLSRLLIGAALGGAVIVLLNRDKLPGFGSGGANATPPAKSTVTGGTVTGGTASGTFASVGTTPETGVVSDAPPETGITAAPGGVIDARDSAGTSSAADLGRLGANAGDATSAGDAPIGAAGGHTDAPVGGSGTVGTSSSGTTSSGTTSSFEAARTAVGGTARSVDATTGHVEDPIKVVRASSDEDDPSSTGDAGPGTWSGRPSGS